MPSQHERALETLTSAFTLGGYRMGSLAARLTPGPLADAAASMIGVSLSAGFRSKRAIIERHLQRVNPDLRGLALRRASAAAFDSYARYYVESFRLPSISSRVVDASFTQHGYEEYLVPALERGKGAIIALPHLGGWEWAGRWTADQGHRISVVVERLEPPELFDWFVDLRRELGMNVIPLGPSAAGEVLKALARNDVVCLLCDRNIGEGGVEVEFFGERTKLPAGPAALALRSGAAVLPTAVYFTRQVNGHHGVVRPPVPVEREGRLRDDVARITQLIAYELEHLIRHAPEQWHLFQPNWPSDPGYEG